MGKIARTIALVHDHTTDNLVDAGSFVARKVKNGVVSGIAAVKIEHTVIETKRAAKKDAKRAQEEAMEEMLATAAKTAAAASARNKAKSTPTTA